jgi:hypothetical protein
MFLLGLVRFNPRRVAYAPLAVELGRLRAAGGDRRWRPAWRLDVLAQELVRRPRGHPGDPYLRCREQPSALDLARERELAKVVGSLRRREPGGQVG